MYSDRCIISAAPNHRPPLNFYIKIIHMQFPIVGIDTFLQFSRFSRFFVIHKISHAPLTTTTTKKKKKNENRTNTCVCWNQHMLLILNPFFECEMSSSPVSYLFSFRFISLFYPIWDSVLSFRDARLCSYQPTHIPTHTQKK